MVKRIIKFNNKLFYLMDELNSLDPKIFKGISKDSFNDQLSNRDRFEIL